MSIIIEIGSTADIVALSKLIPEFEQATTFEQLESRLAGVVSLILVAKCQGALIGYKVGYQFTEDTFYSWLGGVIPEHRKHGVATQLLNYQEKWVWNAGYKQIKVKSMDRFPSMLKMLTSNGYEIVGLDKSVCGSEDKIVFLKRLVV
ncbi:GNAT family N-acetyltransferase [Rheinheimera sp. UJ63]|uniref:GNAT family N-acetyltransferase n=1 Tax=Rheinheimera sp. UJ63 TaxID=2910157 RepID=UPI001F327F6B|nr:GNAT family N-acetyltransferase [Rheinheimera sp. UJ63]MCF4009508.1 GNAT family N-acetyltransferase [Rheinheimera sp. UJ63]